MDLLGLNTVTSVFEWRDVYENYVLKEYYGMQRLEKIWMEAVDEGSDARYSFTL